MKYMRKGASGGVMKYVLFGLLGMAVGGLAFSGSFTGGGTSGGNDVAKIGDKVINIRDFDLALRRSISRYNISTQQAYKLGLVDEVLTREIRSHLLQNESQRLGLEIGKDKIANKIAQIIEPYKQDGITLQDTLKDILRRQGMSEKSFIAGIKREVSGDILTKAIRDSFNPDTNNIAKDLYLFQEQTRDIDMIIFPDSEITSIKPATEDQLKRLYEAVKSSKYKIPEYRKVQTAAFNIEEIDVEFDARSEEIKEYYEENIKNYAVGEQFILSQALVQDQKTAEDIYALTEKGQDLKNAVTQIMGKDDKYLEKIPFVAEVMLPELNKALESRTINKIMPPVKTALGYHVVKLENILAPSTKPLTSVTLSIKNELIEAKKSDYLYDISTQFDELLSDNMSFEDIAKEIDIELSTIDLIDANGLNKESISSLENFKEEDKALILETIFEIESDTPSSMQELSDKFIAFSLITKEEATFKPYKEVKAEIDTQFIADGKRIENQQRTRKFLAELTTGGSTLETIAKDNKKAIKQIKNITIGGETEAPLNENIRPLIFKTDLYGYEVLNLDGSTALIKVSGYKFPEINDDSKDKIIAIQDKINEEAKDEALLTYLNMLSNKNPATINKRLLDKAYSEQDNAE